MNNYDFWFWLNSLANLTQLESYDLLKKDINNIDLMKLLKHIVSQNTEIINILKEDKKMNEMESNNRSEYVTGGYRDYRGNYRYNNRDYRDNYRDDYRDYDMRGGRRNNRNNRNYREEEVYEEIENAMYEAKECHRKMEDLAEMTENPQIKNTLNKIAMREKEHYTSLKELMEK